eukprot:scaffold6915_cov170-Amphora_coffeaeformis.AAC.6
MKRNDLVYWCTTPHAQSSRNDPKIIQDWIFYMQNMCKTYGITNNCMANFDKTDIQKPDGSGQCTVMLGCAADGKKFPPYVIYKGKTGTRVAKELRKWEVKGKPSGCFYKAQEKDN